MSNPVIAEVMRGGIVESRHTGAFAVVNGDGKIMRSDGDFASPIFPRSAIKAFQCAAMIEGGAAEHFGFTDEDIALACSSHNGEPAHVMVARAMLQKAHTTEGSYECGVQWPSRIDAQRELARKGEEPSQVHNNCSGKHAGMLALAKHLGAEPHDYVKIDHPVQQAIARTISDYCDVEVESLTWGIDGCSVPTWAFPLSNMALGFARLTQTAAGKRIIEAVRKYPFLVAGTGRFDTRLMEAVPRAFVKVGAEGVYCGCIPHANIGVALKCDDGATRAAETAMALVLASLDVWTREEHALLQGFAHADIRNWRNITTGDVHAVMRG